MRHYCIAIALLAGSIAGHAQVVVNEVCASNLNSFADNYNRYEDWFELYNTSADVVDISGWWVSNRAGNPLKWEIPAGTTMEPYGFQVFVCSRRNEVSGGYLHPDFNLNQTDHDHVLLSNADGVLVDQFSFTETTKTKRNHSWIRFPDGGEWSLSTTPTANAANTGATAYYPPRPLILLPAGFYSGAQQVAITGPEEYTIRYTLNGSEPTATSQEYTGPIDLAATTVIRAACFGEPGTQSSFMVTNTYLIDEGHTIDVISISGDQLQTLLGGSQIEPWGHLEYFTRDGILRDVAYGEFNEHGQDSWAYGQRGIDYITRDETGYNDGIHHNIFRTTDRTKYKRLIIKAAAGDNYDFGPGQPAHIRDMYVNALSQLAGLDLDERSYEPCILYVNGLYWGVYDVREKVDDHDYTRYYYGQDRYNLQFLKTWGGTWSEYGGPQSQTDWTALRNYIQNNDMGDPDNFAYVDDQLNWHSLVDYFCLNSYTVCSDWLNWNTGWWRGMDPNGGARKWRYILWDMDATFNHYANFTNIPNQTATAPPCQAEQLNNPGGQGHTTILTKLINENEEVRDYYVNRYIDLANTHFSCEFMLPFLDSLITQIEPEMPRQIARWNGSFAGWQNNVQVLRNFIETRCVTIQQGLIDCYDLEGPHEVIFDVEPANSGSIRINSIIPDTYAFTGIYYDNISMELAPIPLPGYTFSHWEVQSGPPVIQPGLTDSLVTTMITGPATIIAHFLPEVLFDVVLNVEPPNSGVIRIGPDIPTEYPHYAQKPQNSLQELAAIPADNWVFSHWETTAGNPVTASTLDSLITLTLNFPDSIIAHFQPPPHYDVVLDMEPRNGGAIVFDGNTYTTFPVTLNLQQLIPREFHVEPAPFFNFSHWRIINNVYDPDDSTSTHLTIGPITNDSIIAIMIPEDFWFEMPNTFTPNGDNVNDILAPMGNAIDAANFEMEIFNRWGQSVYSTNNLMKGWNGHGINGDEVPEGVYMFRITVQDAIRQEQHTLSGHVTLLR